MADLNFQFGSGKPKSKFGDVASRIFLCLFATPFAGFGLFAIAGGIKKIHAGSNEGIFLCLFGLVFAAVGFGLMYAAITAGRRQKASEEKWAAQTEGGKKVWMARDDWAAGKIKSRNLAQGIIFLIMGTMFSVIGGISTFFVFKQELPKGNYAALLVLLFPLVGVAFLGAFVRGMLAQRRFGNCWFELAQVPAPLGGSLDGLIQTERPLILEQGLHLKLSCIRRTVTGSGKNRHTHENILWQDEKVFRSDAPLPTDGLGGSGIPVHFNLPADQPESTLRGDSNVIWRLEARAKMAGPDFTAMFEVPVFHVEGTPLKQAQTAPDPTAALQMTAEEIRRDENSKILVNQVPDGLEFYFPAARNPGTAFGLTIFSIIWTGVIWLMIHWRAPILFPIVFGLIDVFLLWGCLSLWFKSSRVIVNGSGITLHTRWLIFSRTCQFEAGEISAIKLNVGMTSGSTAFQDIKLITRAAEQDGFAARKARYEQTGESPRLELKGLKISDATGITLGGGIASKPEAEWLVREMTRALGRSI